MCRACNQKVDLHVLDVHQLTTATALATCIQLPRLTAVSVPIQHSFLHRQTQCNLCAVLVLVLQDLVGRIRALGCN